ncbi:formate dehydrogenase accessory sulfurtransferase FdhD [Xanthomonadaceae bacterium JHOS43]|nr:formate dehydrogenase accessory sulfurtransferase FdhD [Xanthomonadaceae bacterium JHOS43]MCX7563501.1 formate dehydrogenase accessory sulfurtransferase FdhD [Xanthomonadaceae bacterium XH05]
MSDSDSDSANTTPGCVRRSISRWRDGVEARLIDLVAEEVPIALHVNGTPYAVMMATPCDLDDFALGFSLSEGLIRTPEELHAVQTHERVEGIVLDLQVADTAPAASLASDTARVLPGRSGCGVCGTRLLEEVVRPPEPVSATHRYSAAALQRALANLPDHQPMNALTGAIHAAAWADVDGRIVLVREDVGRHNALDKLTGAMHRHEMDAGTGLLLISSRASYEMVTKTARAGIGVMAAVSAPTALAIGLARSAGVCLIGFARAHGYNVYTCPERLDSA